VSLASARCRPLLSLAREASSSGPVNSLAPEGEQQWAGQTSPQSKAQRESHGGVQAKGRAGNGSRNATSLASRVDEQGMEVDRQAGLQGKRSLNMMGSQARQANG
jgi:hypothetical protein